MNPAGSETRTRTAPVLTHTWHSQKTNTGSIPVLTGLAYLLLQMPYVSSTKAKERFRQRKKNRFREVLSARIDLKVTQAEGKPSTRHRRALVFTHDTHGQDVGVLMTPG